MSQPGADATRYRIRFVERAGDGERVFLEFADPAPARAVGVAIPPGSDEPPPAAGEVLEVLCVAGQPSDAGPVADEVLRWVQDGLPAGAAPPVTIQLHGTQVVWSPGRVAILAAADRWETLLLAVIDFTYHERELARLERTVAEGWPQLQADMPLAFEVTPRDLERRESVGRQFQRMLAVKMAHARLVPHLHRPGALLATLANQLGERLRERTRVEDRLDALAAQIEVYERVYETAGQRLAEFRLSRQEQTLEWVIIILLAVETLLLLVDLLWTLER